MYIFLLYEIALSTTYLKSKESLRYTEHREFKKQLVFIGFWRLEPSEPPVPIR